MTFSLDKIAPVFVLFLGFVASVGTVGLGA
jgi:hypothetical protein